MKKITGMTGAFAAALMLGLVGCGGGAEDNQADQSDGDSHMAAMETASKTFNSQCPIMGGDVEADVATVDYNGKTIGFCCEECIDEWVALSNEKKDNVLASMMDAAKGIMEEAGEHLDHGDHGGG